MEDKHGLPTVTITTSARGRLTLSKEIVVNCIIGVQINRSRNMTPVVLILETTINNNIGIDLGGIISLQNAIKLEILQRGSN